MKTYSRYVFLLFAAGVIQSCGNAERGDRDQAAKTVIDSTSDTTARAQAVTADIPLNGDGKNFIIAASSGGLMQLEAATTTIKRSKNKELKTLAAQIISVHTKLNSQLADLARQKGITLPKTLAQGQLDDLSALKELNEKQFDQQYATMTIADHANMVQLFTQAAQLPDPLVKKFAAANLPLVDAHYQEAVKIGHTLNLTHTGNGDDLQGISPARTRPAKK